MMVLMLLLVTMLLGVLDSDDDDRSTASIVKKRNQTGIALPIPWHYLKKTSTGIKEEWKLHHHGEVAMTSRNCAENADHGVEDDDIETPIMEGRL